MASQDKVQDVTQKKDEVRKRQAVETADMEQEMASAEQADLATLQRTVANPGGISADDVPALQRMVGNRAAARLLAGQSPQVQAKLVVGPAGDKYEREADQVAKQVVNTVQETSQSPTVQRQEDDELKKLLLLEEENVQTKPEITSGPPVVQRAGRSLAGDVDPTTGATAVTTATATTPATVGAVTLLDWLKTAGQGIADLTRPGSTDYGFRDAKVRISRAEPGLPGISGSSEEIWLKSMPTAADSLQRLTGWGTVADEEGLLEDHSFEVSVNLETRLKELAGQGNPLPETLQDEMENAFKADFG